MNNPYETDSFAVDRSQNYKTSQFSKSKKPQSFKAIRTPFRKTSNEQPILNNRSVNLNNEPTGFLTL
jgi:hypothetical protein